VAAFPSTAQQSTAQESSRITPVPSLPSPALLTEKSMQWVGFHRAYGACNPIDRVPYHTCTPTYDRGWIEWNRHGWSGHGQGHGPCVASPYSQSDLVWWVLVKAWLCLVRRSVQMMQYAVLSVRSAAHCGFGIRACQGCRATFTRHGMNWIKGGVFSCFCTRNALPSPPPFSGMGWQMIGYDRLECDGTGLDWTG